MDLVFTCGLTASQPEMPRMTGLSQRRVARIHASASRNCGAPGQRTPGARSRPPLLSPLRDFDPQGPGDVPWASTADSEFGQVPAMS
jgi:hypothetical protein